MPQIHNSDLYGPLGAASNLGIAGQVLTSQGPGNQVVWSNGGKFTFASASSLSHVIVHNLNNDYPNITVWDTATDEVIHPVITSNNPNQITITFFVARAIAGTITG